MLSKNIPFTSRTETQTTYYIDGLREITYLHMYSCHCSELIENSLCQFCLFSHCPPCTDASGGGPERACRPALLALTCSPDVVCLAACDLSVWKTLMSVSFEMTESKCFHFNSGLQFMWMWMFGLAVFAFTLSTLTMYGTCVHILAYSVGIFIS